MFPIEKDNFKSVGPTTSKDGQSSEPYFRHLSPTETQNCTQVACEKARLKARAILKTYMQKNDENKSIPIVDPQETFKIFSIKLFTYALSIQLFFANIYLLIF